MTKLSPKPNPATRVPQLLTNKTWIINTLSTKRGPNKNRERNSNLEPRPGEQLFAIVLQHDLQLELVAIVVVAILRLAVGVQETVERVVALISA